MPVFFTMVKYAENKIRRNHLGCAVSVPMCATAPAASLHSLAVVRNGNSVRITRSLPPPPHRLCFSMSGPSLGTLETGGPGLESSSS